MIYLSNLSPCFILCLLSALSIVNVNALSYGTTCATTVDLTTTIGVGAGFFGLVDAPFDKSWYISTLSTPLCSNSVNTLIASQQWVWYSVNAGSSSSIAVSTTSEHGADTGSVDTLLFATTSCSSTLSPASCNDDYAGFAPKSYLSLSGLSGAYKIAIGQYATSSTSGVAYSVGKVIVAQYCIDSCATCNALPAKLFSPNSAVLYTTLFGGTPMPSSCGTIYAANYYTFIAHSAGFVLVSTCTADGAAKTHSSTTRIAVYSGSSCSTLVNCVTGDSSCSNSARVTFSVNQGLTYTVVIGSTTSISIFSGYDGVGVPVFTFTCAVGTYDDDNNQNTACATCTPKTNCASVSCTSGASSICTVCNSGFYINSGSCSACTPVTNCNTVTCSSSSNSVCTACNDGFYVSSGSCSLCASIPNCNSVTCTDSSNSVCTSCQVGYYIIGTGSCVTCTPVANCAVAACTNSSNSVCNTCNSDYYWSSGACNACTPVTNCISTLMCSTSSNSVCTSCSSGSYLNSGNTCSVCTQKTNCTNVTCTSSASSTCTACTSGSYLSGGSCLTCSAKPNCAVVNCISAVNSVCISCNSGYYLNSASICAACTPVDHCVSPLTCSTSSNSICTSCGDGYFVRDGSCTLSCPSGTYLSGDGSSCIDCTPVPNCNSALTCSNSLNSVCTSCNSGYYVNGGVCATCSPIPNCKSDLACSNSANSVCTSCVSGTYLSSPSTCSNCLTKSNCATISCSNGTVSVCTTCVNGYTLLNGNCSINKNNNESGSSSPIAAIAGAVGGILVLLLVIVVIVILKRRKNNSGLKIRQSQSPDYEENTIPLSNVSISSNSHFSPSTSTTKLYDTPIATQNQESEYDSPLFTRNNNNSSHSARIYDYITPYAKQVLPHPSIERDILLEGVIGNGSFGVVKLGKIQNSRVPPYCKDLISKERKDNFLLCAVKTLKEGSDEKSKRDFADEGRVMANFNHPNVIRMIAVLLDATPPMLVTEFMKYGDLRGLLNKSESKSLHWHIKEFLFVLYQIAQGMEYLQSIRFIHRDLAARNCLVSNNLTVKISDFGLSKELEGDKDYYKLQTKGRLPIKWMAPESIGYRRFTHASDVWSFGVTMWEVFSYAHSPYGEARGPDILTLLERGVRLECPSPCLSIPIVYEWMLKCWEYDPSNRPSFSESVQFLSSQIDSPSVHIQEIRNIGELLS